MRPVETPFREPDACLRAKQQEQDSGRDQGLHEIRYCKHDDARAEEYQQEGKTDVEQLRRDARDRYVTGLHEGIEPVVHDIDRRKQKCGAGDRNQGKADRAETLISNGVQQQSQVARQDAEKLQKGGRAQRLSAQSRLLDNLANHQAVQAEMTGHPEKRHQGGGVGKRSEALWSEVARHQHRGHQTQPHGQHLLAHDPDSVVEVRPIPPVCIGKHERWSSSRAGVF